MNFMNMESAQLFFALAFVLFLILIAARILVRPLRLLVKLVFNSLIGLLMLLGFNIVGGLFGITIPVNVVTILFTGFLGIPGLILLIAVKVLGI